MKKLILIITLLVISINVNSQITKDYWMVGGSGYYKFSKLTLDNGSGNEYSYITIKSDIGYFIKDKWAIGGILRYDDDLNPHSYNRNINGGLGILTRYYFLNPNRITNIYAQINYTYTINFTQLDHNKLIQSHYYGVKLGYVVFFTNSVGLETFFEYEKANYIPAHNSRLTIKVGIGFHIHLIK